MRCSVLLCSSIVFTPRMRAGSQQCEGLCKPKGAAFSWLVNSHPWHVCLNV